MNLTRKEILEIANNVDSLNMMDKVLLSEVVGEIENFVGGGQMDVTAPGDQRKQIDSYAAIPKPTGDIAYVRAYKDGTFDLLDKDTFSKEFVFNFLPKKYKESMRVKLGNNTPKSHLYTEETPSSGTFIPPEQTPSVQT